MKPQSMAAVRPRPPRPTLTESVEDFSRGTVPASVLHSTADLALVRMGLTVSATDLVFGYTIGLYFGFWQAIWIALGYSLVISVIAIAMGIIGLRERTSYALSSRFAFGREGSRLPSLVMAVIITGFYGYVLGITVDVIPGLGWAGALAVSVALGAIYVVVTALGFSIGLKWVGRVAVPIMIVLVLVADVVTVAHAGGVGAIVSATPRLAGRMALPAIIGLGVAKWMGGAVISPDVMRFARSGRAVVVSTLAEFVVGNFGFNLLGLILGLGLGASDLGRAFALIGVSALAVVAFLVQSVTVEMNELYAGSLAVSNALGVRRLAATIAIGVIGIGIGYYGVTQGIIASFLTFIGWIGYALPAIPGIMLADYFVVRRMHYPEGLAGLPAVNWRAIATFVITLVVNLVLGLLLKDALWHSLPVIAFVVYLLLSAPQTVRAWSRTPAPAQ